MRYEPILHLEILMHSMATHPTSTLLPLIEIERRLHNTHFRIDHIPPARNWKSEDPEETVAGYRHGKTVFRTGAVWGCADAGVEAGSDACWICLDDLREISSRRLLGHSRFCRCCFGGRLWQAHAHIHNQYFLAGSMLFDLQSYTRRF